MNKTGGHPTNTLLYIHACLITSALLKVYKQKKLVTPVLCVYMSMFSVYKYFKSLCKADNFFSFTHLCHYFHLVTYVHRSPI